MRERSREVERKRESYRGKEKGFMGGGCRLQAGVVREWGRVRQLRAPACVREG